MSNLYVKGLECGHLLKCIRAPSGPVASTWLFWDTDLPWVSKLCSWQGYVFARYRLYVTRSDSNLQVGGL